MKVLLFSLILLLFWAQQSSAQQPGAVQWANVDDLSPGFDTIHSMKVQTDGKIVTAGNSYDHSMYKRVMAVGRYVGAIPDLSFGSNGLVTTSLDSAHTVAKAVAIQTDGKIVVAGGSQKGTTGDFLVARYNPNGSPDSSFGINGVLQTDMDSGSFDGANALAIRLDGKLVAAGWSGQSLALCRYNTDGSLDSSFDVDGKLVVAASIATSMKLQANGKIVLCCGNMVVRLNPDGSLDTGFGANGIVSLNYNFNDVALQNDGKILLAGSPFVLQRLDTAGAIDVSFGSSGTVMTSGFVYGASNPGQSATWVCVQTDGRILAGGWAKFCMLGDCRVFAVARYKPNGRPDSSFGNSGNSPSRMYGKATSNSASSFDRAATSYAAAITANNDLIVAGSSADGTFDASEGKWALASFYLGPPLSVQTVPVGDEQITVAPNPSSGVITFSAPSAIQRIVVTDLTGKVVYREQPRSLTTTIDLGGKATGVYFYEVESGSGKERGKLVIH